MQGRASDTVPVVGKIVPFVRIRVHAPAPAPAGAPPGDSVRLGAHAIAPFPPRGPPVNARRGHYWLALLPAIGICVGSPLVDRMHATLAGFPLLLVWIVACVILTSV